MSGKISVLGASNVDITGFTKQALIYGDANIGYTQTAPGGVGRNIAENLHLLGFQVELISVFGDDPLSTFIINSCKQKSLDIAKSLFLQNKNAATFLAVMDEKNDLAVGISAMDIYNDLEETLLLQKIEETAPFDYLVMETNFQADILEAVAKTFTGNKIVVDTVSGKKALRIKHILPELYILKTNLLEAQMIAGSFGYKSLNNKELARFFIEKGVQYLFITLGEKGVIYADKNGVYSRPSIPAPVVNTLGAGDSFVAGIIYADSRRLNIHQMALYGMASAHINVQSNTAVAPEMSADNLQIIVDHSL